MLEKPGKASRKRCHLSWVLLTGSGDFIVQVNSVYQKVFSHNLSLILLTTWETG